MLNIKITVGIISAIIGSLAFIPYLRDTFSLKTKPHAYTWLIFTITQGTAVTGILYGQGGWGGLNLIIGTLLVFSVFLFSLKYGTKNITKSDTIILILSILAILVWWQLHQPAYAVLMVTFIDFLGYLPSFRKSFREPWSETLISWAAFAASDIFALMALKEYNILTVTYLLMIASVNTVFFIFCLSRRSFVAKPVSD